MHMQFQGAAGSAGAFMYCSRGHGVNGRMCSSLQHTVGKDFTGNTFENIISTLHELHVAISVSSLILLKRIKETSIPSCRGLGWWWVLPKFIIHPLNTNQVSGEYFQGRVRLKYNSFKTSLIVMSKKQSYKA